MDLVLTISKLKRWSINYYIDTARAAETASRDVARAGGGLGEYYSEHETRTPSWLLAGDTHTVATLVGLTDAQRVGGEADAELVARWLDDGIAPNGARGRAFGHRGVHGFDLTFCAPKSVSLVRALRADDVVAKAIADAHTTALSEAMEYLAAHAGYARVHNPRTGEKDLVRLPGLAAIAYQHETSRCGDPHLHTHVIVPNRQARADGVMVSIDGTSLYHEAKAAGVIYQATLPRAPPIPGPRMGRRRLVDGHGRARWRRSRHHHRLVAALHCAAGVGRPSPARCRRSAVGGAASGCAKGNAPGQARRTRLDAPGAGVARRCARPAPGPRSLRHRARRAAHISAHPYDTARIMAAADKIDKAAFTRADLIEILGAQLPIDTERTPRELLESAVDEVAVRLTAPRAAHQREGHERFTLDAILQEEAAVLDLVDAREDRAMLWINDDDTAHLSPDQARAVENIGRSPWLIQPLSAPAGAGKTTSMRALRSAVHRRFDGTVLLLAPTGKAVDVAVRESAGDQGYTIAKALQLLRRNELELGPHTLVVVDEAAMVGTGDLRQLLTATTVAGAKTVLVGDAHQLAPVKARGGMFAQLCTDLPWTQHLSAVWRMRDPDERAASLALRIGGPASVRRAIGWYRTHDRLRCGDQITMAANALAAYQADTAAGKDALLTCDTTEMADALNQRIHHDTIAAHAPTVTAARGHRIGVGDLILTRRNDASIPLRNTDDPAAENAAVRNGQRWRVTRINPDNNRLIARRLDDNTLGAFSNDYVREHITHGYAVTVHSAQGVTADTAHAVLSENATRALSYVAMTRGRDTNTAYLYQRTTEHEHQQDSTELSHVMHRGSRQHAAKLLRTILTNDDQPVTAHHVLDAHDALPLQVRRASQRRAIAVRDRRADYDRWRDASYAFMAAMREAPTREVDPSQTVGYEMDL